MSDQIIGASIQVDASSVPQASKSISELKDNVKLLRKEFEDSKAGTAQQAEAFKKLKAAEDELNKTTAESTKVHDKATGSFKNLKEGMGSLPGPLAVAGEGVNKLNATFVRLLANPVVLIIAAIVAALALLYKAFTNSFEGGEKMEQVFAAIKAAAQALIDNITKIAGAIVKLFKFDFSGAINDIKGVVKAVGEAAIAMANLTKQAQDLKREQLANDLDQAKRAKELAILREQATDETIPIAKRRAALQQLKKDAEQNAKEDIDLARRVTENKIAQLTLQKDGDKKNLEEITKLKIEQLNVETENANELRRINKQLTLADKQEKAEQKEAAQKAAEEAKKRRQEVVEFTNKLQKIQQENELAQIADAYEKEKKLLQNKIADDKRANELAFQDKKVSLTQFHQVEAALEEQAKIQLQALEDKHNKELAQKQADFEKELNAIKNKIKLDGLTDARVTERQQLQAAYEDKLADATKRYKDDNTKLQAIKQALEEENRADQAKLDQKFALEDEKKETGLQLQKLKLIADNIKAQFALRLQAVDDEQAIFKKQFDDKILTEEQYNDKVAQLAEARKAIKAQEKKHNEEVTDAIGAAFGNLSKIVGEQTAAGKAFAVAQTTIDTYSSAVKAFNSLADIPVVGPALGAIAAAAAISNGIASVKKILAVQVPGQGSGGGAVPSAPGVTQPAPIAPTQAGTTIDQASINAIGNASSGRAFVLDADVANNRERNERLNRAARLGG